MPGPRAVGLALGGLAAIAGGAALRWSELVGTGAGLVVLLAVDLWLVRRPRSARWQEMEVPNRVVRGDDAVTRLSLSVDGDPRWVSAAGAGARRWVSGPLLEWPIDSARRGAQPDGPAVLAFADPLGLRACLLAERSPGTVLVVPRVRPFPTFADARAAEGLMAESPGADHFQSIREYVVGDPLRSVHWRTSARLGTLAVRTMTDARSPGVLVVLDTGARSYDRTGSQFADFDAAAFEEAVELAASACWAGATGGRRVSLATTTRGARTVDVDGGSRWRALDLLALVEPTEHPAPSRIAAESRRLQVPTIVLVTGRSGRATALGLPRGAATVSVVRAP